MSEHTHGRQVVVFTLGAEQYALPIKQVQEIIRYQQPRSVASHDYSACGVISLRGRLVAVHDLAARLGASSELTDESKIVIIETGHKTVGVIVDAVNEVLTVADDQIEDAPGADKTLIDAIAKIEDRLVVLLDPSTIFNDDQIAA
ncbi:MAG: chemotaxis protein CheW [Solirubrobacteraceae bacterium]